MSIMEILEENHVPVALRESNCEVVISSVGKRKIIIHIKEEYIPLHNLEAVIHSKKIELKNSYYFRNFKKILFDGFRDTSFANDVQEDIDVVCYGLGRFSFDAASRYQLGFLLLLKDILNSTNIYIYDPKFSVEEISFLKDLGMKVLRVNEEGKRQMKKKTVCFMPLCPVPLYNNLLWANWSIKNLSELVIIGNSFKMYRSLGCKEAKYVDLTVKFITEIRITNNFRYTDIFNSMSIHYFKLNSLTTVDPLVWTEVDEPEYIEYLKGYIRKRRRL